MYKFYLIVGSQLLYGDEIIKRVEKNAKLLASTMKTSYQIEYKGIIMSNDDTRNVIIAANSDANCAGIITWCHTFSPSKLWINGLKLLQKPWLHLHTQLNECIPNEEIDMNYMNLHQSAHGDREHGFIANRIHAKRKIIVGHYKDAKVIEKISNWQQICVAAMECANLRIVRLGDNMREVASTDGDKIEAQIKLGWQVNTYQLSELVDYIDKVTDSETNKKFSEYKEKYILKTDNIESVKYQIKCEIALKRMLEHHGAKAFTDNFEDLTGMKQLPGLAAQELMAQGYGFGGEGDWKVAGLCRIFKAIGKTATFMEDYTYDFQNGLILGSHMLEICPSIAVNKPAIEVHDLFVGGKDAPARLVFNGKAGQGKILSLVDVGGRYRLIVLSVSCVEPTQTMPNLPVPRVMWKPEPSLEVSAECWLLAGGSHHVVLVYDIDEESLIDFGRIMDIEVVCINKDTNFVSFEKELELSNLVWKLK